MAIFSRSEVIEKFIQSGLVPLFYHQELETVKEVVKSCYEGGARIFEFTNRGDFAHEIFSELKKYVSQNLPDLILGVGTVLDAQTASIYLQLGSNFVISPILNKEIGSVCHRRKVLWMPGCATFTEISNAESLGAEIIKIFPANLLGGPDFIKSIKAPCPWISMMPSGGISPTEESMGPYFHAGAVCVGIGSNLITKEIVRNNDFSQLKNNVRSAFEIIKKIRNS